MRLLILAGLWSFVLTLGAALALGGDSAVIAVVALAALVATITWFAAQYSDDDLAGATTTGTGATVALTIAGRSPGTLFVPLIAAQAVGAVLAGGLVRLASDSLPTTLAWTEPGLAAAAVGGLLVGVLCGWVIVFVDGYLNDGVSSVTVLLGGGLISIGYALAFQPMALMGLAVADITQWSTSLAAGGGVLFGAVVAGISVGLLVPPPPEASQNTDR